MTNYHLITHSYNNSEILGKLMEEIEQTPEEYLPNLLQIIREFRENVTLKSAEESFRQGWHEAMTENTFPVSQLWDGIDAE
jgi:hypothetical protein